MGGGYADVLAGFAQALFAQADASVGKPACLKLVVLPTAYSSDPGRITDAERARNLHDAARRCRQIEEACNRAAPAGLTCTAVVAPIFTRADAADPAKYAPLTGDVSAVFMLGGDQTVAMAAGASAVTGASPRVKPRIRVRLKRSSTPALLSRTRNH